MGNSKTYTIRYHGNGATSGSVDSHVCTTGQTCTIKANGFKKGNYKFIGWTTKSNGQDDGYGWTGWSGTWKYTNEEWGISDNFLDLYAVWAQ